jgi:RNA polymerase sigma-70 factor (ECF subfamily)
MTAIAPSAALTAELTDQEIVRRVLDGEPGLFELLMRRHNQPLFRILRGVVRDGAEAEDLLQDAWVKAFQHLPGSRFEAGFRTWMARIALHEAAARGRKGRRLVALSSPEELALEAPRETDPEHRASTAELRRLLEGAIGGLSPIYRAVVMLRDVEGFSTAETAEVLDVSLEVVKVRLHRGRALLRKELTSRLDGALPEVFAFAGDRCDRVVARVLERLRLAG